MKTEKTNVISLVMYLTRVNETIYVGLDGNPLDIEAFGIKMEEFRKIADDIADFLQQRTFKLEKKEEDNG